MIEVSMHESDPHSALTTEVQRRGGTGVQAIVEGWRNASRRPWRKLNLVLQQGVGNRAIFWVYSRTMLDKTSESFQREFHLL